MDFYLAAVHAALRHLGHAGGQRRVLLANLLVLLAVLPLAALAGDGPSVGGAPQRDGHAVGIGAGREQKPVLHVVHEGEIRVRPRDSRVCKALVVVGGDVEGVVHAVFYAKARVARRVIDAGGHLAHAAAQLVFVRTVHDDGRLLEALGLGALACRGVKRPGPAGLHKRAVDELAQKLDVVHARARARHGDRPRREALDDAHLLRVFGANLGLDDHFLDLHAVLGALAEQVVLHGTGSTVVVRTGAHMAFHNLDRAAARVKARVAHVAFGLVAQ